MTAHSSSRGQVATFGPYRLSPVAVVAKAKHERWLLLWLPLLLFPALIVSAPFWV